MGFVTKSLRLSDRELAFVDARCFFMCVFRGSWWSKICTFFTKLLSYRRMLPAAVVPRRSRNWGCVIGVKTKPMLRCGNDGLNHAVGLKGGRFGRPIQGEPKRFSEGGECALGGTRFGCF